MKTFADPKHCFLVGAQGITPVTATLYTSLARPHKLHTLVLRIYRYQREIQYSAPSTTGTWCQDWLGARRASHWDWCTRWTAGGPRTDGGRSLCPKNYQFYWTVLLSAVPSLEWSDFFFISQNRASNRGSGMMLEVQIQHFDARRRMRIKVFIFKKFLEA